jgi:hypothetical protein
VSVPVKAKLVECKPEIFAQKAKRAFVLVFKSYLPAISHPFSPHFRLRLASAHPVPHPIPPE